MTELDELLSSVVGGGAQSAGFHRPRNEGSWATEWPGLGMVRQFVGLRSFAPRTALRMTALDIRDLPAPQRHRPLSMTACEGLSMQKSGAHPSFRGGVEMSPHALAAKRPTQNEKMKTYRHLYSQIADFERLYTALPPRASRRQAGAPRSRRVRVSPESPSGALFLKPASRPEGRGIPAATRDIRV